MTDLLDAIEDQHGAAAGRHRARHLPQDDQLVHDPQRRLRVAGGARHAPEQRRRRKRKRVLADEEIRALWAAGDDIDTYGALLKVLLLSAQRHDNVATMRWDDLKRRRVDHSAAPREKSHAGSLRLPPLLLDIIQAQPRLAENPYVFAGRGGGRFNSFAQRKDELTPRCPPCRRGSFTICAAARAR